MCIVDARFRQKNAKSDAEAGPESVQNALRQHNGECNTATVPVSMNHP